MPVRILLIEDNPTNMELMTYLLEAFGYAPTCAMDGEEGLAIAARERPDLIICDIQLPGIDGYEVARQLKGNSELCTIPLLAVTASAMVGDREKALAAGFDGYIPKPISPHTFVQQMAPYLPQHVLVTLNPWVQQESEFLPPTDKNCLVLVVDNEPVNLELARSLLNPHGYKVVTALGMRDALAFAKETLPDLIISDVGMPDGDGFAFIKEVKGDPQFNKIPFMLITSTACMESARIKGLALGASRFIFRPIESQRLLTEIEACLQERNEVRHGNDPDS